MIITIEELNRRITVFQKVLPGNPSDNADWTRLEISRCMLKHCVQRLFNPSVETDKHDLHFELRRQYYNDIKLAAVAKSIKLRAQTAQLKAARLQTVY